MQRYILNNETKTFYKTDLHHIKNVMRMKSGDQVIVCLNNECYLSELIINDEITYNFIEKIEQEKSTNITLIQGLIKGSKIETTLKYGTIFGAKAFILAEFDRSIVKVKNNDNKLERYFNIVKEAAELSHRESIPNIEIVQKLKNINWDNFDVVILADEEEQLINLRDIIDVELLNQRIAVIVGPEGGISNQERTYFQSINAKSVSLGKYIYPAEIAAISLLNDLKK